MIDSVRVLLESIKPAILLALPAESWGKLATRPRNGGSTRTGSKTGRQFFGGATARRTRGGGGADQVGE